MILKTKYPDAWNHLTAGQDFEYCILLRNSGGIDLLDELFHSEGLGVNVLSNHNSETKDVFYCGEVTDKYGVIVHHTKQNRRGEVWEALLRFLFEKTQKRLENLIAE